jgi:Phage late-transcription coactivator
MTPDDIQKFSMAIEEMVYMKDIPYIDAVVMYCEQTGFEIETAAKLVSGVLKSKIKLEAEDLHFLKKSNTSQLPL